MSVPSEVIREYMQAHASRLTLYGRQFFAHGDFHAAEETVQEVFYRLSRQSVLPENLVAWLYKSVRNGAISKARSEKRRERRESEHFGEPWFQDDSEIDTEQVAMQLEKLDPEQREIVVLHIWSDMPFSEIGELLGKSKTTVFRRYEEALETLRSRLEEP